MRRHSGKAVIALLLAFGTGAWLVITEWVQDRGGETASNIIDSLSGAPIEVRLLPAGTFFSSHPYAPYYVISRERVASPQAVGEAALARMAEQEGFVDIPWTERHGGVSGSPQIVRLELSGKRDEAITITGIRARILRKRPPVTGWYIAKPGCGAEPVRVAEVDLDAPRPIRGFIDAGGRKRHFALSVTKTDREELELQASTHRATVEWKAEVFYSAGDGKTRSVVVPEGKPFMVTTETASEGYRPDFRGRTPGVTREHRWDKAGIAAC